MLSLPQSARLRPLRFGVAVRQDVRRQDGSVSCPCLGSPILGRTVVPYCQSVRLRRDSAVRQDGSVSCQSVSSRQRSVRTSPTAAVRRCHQAVAYFPACLSPTAETATTVRWFSDRSPDWQGPTWNLRCRADCHRRATRRVDFSPCLGVRPTGDSTHRSLCLGLSTSLLSCLSPDRQVRLAGPTVAGGWGFAHGACSPSTATSPEFPGPTHSLRTPGSCQL